MAASTSTSRTWIVEGNVAFVNSAPTLTTRTITYNANGGSVTPATATTGTNGRLATLPTPTRTGHTFNGWFTAATGGTQISTSTIFTANTPVYAQWTEIPIQGYDCGEHGCEECDPCEYNICIRIVSLNDVYVIELHNHTGEVISTKGLFITDDEDDLIKWQIPAIIIRSGEHILIRGSEDSTTPVLKRCWVDFDISLSENIILTDATGTILSVS